MDLWIGWWIPCTVSLVPPAGHHVGGDEEADPGDHDEHAGGEVAGDDVVRHLPDGRHGHGNADHY